jgi:hypothetical protein
MSVQAAASKSKCFQCQKSTEKLSYCGKCRAVAYCSKECQKASWKTHKLACPILTSFKPILGDNEVVCEFYENGQFTPLTQAEFFAKTGITFIFSNRASPGFVTRNASLLVSEVDEPDYSQSLCLVDQGPLGHGVMTKVAIPEGATLCRWMGVIQKESEAAVSHRSGLYRESAANGLFIDGSSKGNLASMINEGPPNCWANPSSGQLVHVKALRPIKANEYLYHDYVPYHAIKSGPYHLTEDGWQTLIDFCKDQDIYHLQKTAANTAMQSYILTTFIPFVKLHLKGVLSAEATLSHLKSNSTFQPLASSSIFGHFYSDILSLIKKAKDSNALDLLDALGQRLTSRSYCQCLLLMQCVEISEETIGTVREFGELLDQLYLWSNGTLIGTLMDRPEEPTDEPFPLDTLIERFTKLPSSLQKHFLTQVNGYIKLNTDREKGANQLKALLEFKESLSKICKQRIDPQI